jgi:hypothetical protein
MISISAQIRAHDIYDTYCNDGREAAMQKFLAQIGLGGPRSCASSSRVLLEMPRGSYVTTVYESGSSPAIPANAGAVHWRAEQ